MWYTPHIAQSLLIIASFNKRNCFHTEAFMISKALDQPKVRVYGALC